MPSDPFTGIDVGAASVRAGVFDATERVIEPDPSVRAYHEAKYQVFLRRSDHWVEYEQLIGRA